MRIAIVGSGVSGLVCAYLLAPRHEVTVFEADDRIGGHVHTVRVPTSSGERHVDTGFIVYNDRTYPEFIKLLDRLSVATQASSMSFSVRCERTNVEYNGTDWNGLFAQRRNLFDPRFLGMLRDVVRFNRRAKEWIANRPDESLLLGDFLKREGYGKRFLDHYILPMGAAIWSSSPHRMLEFPAVTFLRFFQNHGMLEIDDRPTWRVIRGGSMRYVEALMAQTRARFLVKAPVAGVRRHDGGVTLRFPSGEDSKFDHVILAAHADQSLRLLDDANDQERALLGAFAYQENETVLHQDPSLMPRTRRAWAAWNYHVPTESPERVDVTYSMNILQGLDERELFFVSLNRTNDIDPARVVRRLVYHHPVYTRAAIESQSRQDALNGRAGTWYCGAYWGYGFHEDGVKSALRVCTRFGSTL